MYAVAMHAPPGAARHPVSRGLRLELCGICFVSSGSCLPRVDAACVRGTFHYREFDTNRDRDPDMTDILQIRRIFVYHYIRDAGFRHAMRC